MIDPNELLAKYMRYVEDQSGSDYVDIGLREFCTNERFTRAEWAMLEEASEGKRQ